MGKDRILLTKKDLSEYLKCSIGSVDNFMKDGRIKYIKIGKLVRFDKNEVDNNLGLVKNIELKHLIGDGKD
ncbi:MAG: helix-turn-helix domain-containing protein [Chitinophagales bacterium]|tara:strand:+ start:208 stop:420 length:213 start_codon:yes stop_codon:yes gene_type:complete